MLLQTNSTTPKVKYIETCRLIPHQEAHPNQTRVPNQYDNLDLSNVDHVSSNATSSRFGAMLYMFKDTEAVI